MRSAEAPRARALGLLLGALAAVPAQAQLRAPEPGVVLELSTLAPAGPTPGASLWRRDGTTGFDRPGEPGQARARMWWRAGRVDLGTGSDFATDGATAASGGRPVLGLRTELSGSTRFVYELRGADRSARTGAGTETAAESDMRWALEFKPVNSTAQSARSLLRVELSSGSTLSFRPRGGGLAMTWQSRF
jgi:hypothetical protein